MTPPAWRARGLVAAVSLLAIARLAQAAPPSDAGGATAAPPPALATPTERTQPPATIAVNGTCPDAEQIWGAITSLVPAKELGRLAAAKIEVSDLGDSYRVSVSAQGQGPTQGQGIDRLRVYRDPGHDCDHRAHFAAVFIVLTLMPPDLLVEAVPPPPPEPPPPPPPKPVAPPAPVVNVPRPIPARRLRLEIALLADLAPRSGSPWAAAFGGELRAAPGAKRLGPVAAIGFVGGPIDFGGLRVTELRVPFDLGLRIPIFAGGSLDLGADLGVGGALFRDAATNTVDPQSGTRLDVGARAALVMHQGRPGGRLLKIVGLHAEVFPRRYDVTLLPQGTVGQTPLVWFGVTLGLAVQP